MTGGAVTSYTWDGNLLIGQSNGTTTLTFSYDANGNVVSVFYGSDYYYYMRNGQNDIVGILNSSGTQVVAYTYDTWGKLLSVTGSLATTIGAQNPFRYRGYYYDNETGFYYLQSRYYDPNTGRFISPDVLVSTGQGIIGHNMYAYCGNNPVSRVDSTGFSWEDVWNWTKQAGTDAWDWTTQAGTDAWGWTRQAGTDAWDWTRQAGTDAWDWTKQAASDTGQWVGGVWNNNVLPVITDKKFWSKVGAVGEIIAGAAGTVGGVCALLVPDPTMITKVGGTAAIIGGSAAFIAGVIRLFE